MPCALDITGISISYLRRPRSYHPEPMAVSDPIAPARFCTNCGRPRLGGARFCVECGREFDVAAAPPPEQFLFEEDLEPARPYPVTYRATYLEYPSRAGTIFRL